MIHFDCLNQVIHDDKLEMKNCKNQEGTNGLIVIFI